MTETRYDMDMDIAPATLRYVLDIGDLDMREATLIGYVRQVVDSALADVLDYEEPDYRVFSVDIDDRMLGVSLRFKDRRHAIEWVKIVRNATEGEALLDLEEYN